MEQGTGKLSELISNILPSGIFRDFLVEGIIGGVGGVIVFLPNIIILFLFISFMEDTGYMARAAFTVFYTTGIAWLLSFTVYQVGSLFIN